MKDIEATCEAVKARLTTGDLYDLCAAERAVDQAFWKRIVDEN